jgi:hypothetical protein
MVLFVAAACPAHDATVFPATPILRGLAGAAPVAVDANQKQKIPSPNAPSRGKLSGMETIKRQVGEMQAHERSAAELLLGHRLRGNEQLILQVLQLDVTEPPKEDSRPAQTLPDWCNVYEGLTDEEIENIDRSITRCNLSRTFE